ncbi:MAG TPA: hypothetical protein VFX76_04970 [Roseiflexaceae bacterium]|nr:hypothetical protein [Roseiflexaceae bacterium]
MQRVIDIILTDLRYLIGDLGKHGGLIGPSIYDTAQVLRFAPPSEGVWPALEWLEQQQRVDGGWGDPAVPRARDLPTLAAMLALHQYGKRKVTRAAIKAGLVFLQQQAPHWKGALSDDIPVGSELLLPRLLEEAHAVGLNIPQEPYGALIALGARRRQMITRMNIPSATPVLHSWEGWGTEPVLSQIDETGGIGHSPSATAAWLRAAGDRPELLGASLAARNYLERASGATGIDIPGVVPTVWPINRFEQSFALYMLLLGGLLDHPALRRAVRTQIDELERAMRPNGIAMSDIFLPDGDDTAAALAVLHSTGRAIDIGAMQGFAHENHFCAYLGELQPSVSVTAHAAHTLALLGHEHTGALDYLVQHQQPDGRWNGDKWNGSWLYTTSQVVVALSGAEHRKALKLALDALLTRQYPNGSWGTHNATIEETAYGILGLRALLAGGIGDSAAADALADAERWMLAQYRPFQFSSFTGWLGKEMYRPLRLARMIELVATLPSTEALPREHIMLPTHEYLLA